ncbi:MAG: pantoate--beta-alanine ligase [Marinobacter sp.]
MRTVNTIKELRAMVRSWRKQGKTTALVPTMGNLHDGHLSLVRKAAEAADIVITSIFVNPMQFGASEDLASYPRTLMEDQSLLVEAGNTLLFTPSAADIYPVDLAHQTKVVVPDVSEGHCGASRPGHFDGVATVVTMLLNMVQPDFALFGEKDLQQLTIIRKLVRDLMLPVEIIGVAIVRDGDGLAKSSRNGYLSIEDRALAPALYKVLQNIAKDLQSGDTHFARLSEHAKTELLNAGLRPDYVNIVNSQTLKSATVDDRELAILAAVFLGKTRLIDNISLIR